jgi:nitroreductase
VPELPLAPDELLSTTRAVRKRLDLSRPVERSVIEECLGLAQQAPTASNWQDWHFVVVTDPERRAGLAELYRRGGEAYLRRPRALPSLHFDDPEQQAQMERIWDSARYLLEHVHEVPVHVIPCVEGRTDGLPAVSQASRFGSIVPAAWSFMLAARARGLGTCWTTFHLNFEEEAAALLGIPYAEIMQVALIPVAYTKGTDFRPARRQPLEKMVHWDAW